LSDNEVLIKDPKSRGAEEGKKQTSHAEEKGILDQGFHEAVGPQNERVLSRPIGDPVDDGCKEIRGLPE
jgi:hypothetical protein